MTHQPQECRPTPGKFLYFVHVGPDPGIVTTLQVECTGGVDSVEHGDGSAETGLLTLALPRAEAWQVALRAQAWLQCADVVKEG